MVTQETYSLLDPEWKGNAVIHFVSDMELIIKDSIAAYALMKTQCCVR